MNLSNENRMNLSYKKTEVQLLISSICICVSMIGHLVKSRYKNIFIRYSKFRQMNKFVSFFWSRADDGPRIECYLYSRNLFQVRLRFLESMIIRFSEHFTLNCPLFEFFICLKFAERRDNKSKNLSILNIS